MPSPIVKGTRLEDLEFEGKEEILEKKKELVVNTWLSEREVDIYLLYKEVEEFDTLSSIAEALSLSENTVYSHWRKAKDKASQSRETLRLNIPV